MKSLLPKNATKQEKDIEASIARMANIPVMGRMVWDPDTCPEHLLPWLAWAFSVDGWESNWPENVKRQVIKNSYDVHRTKGTPFAVRKALEGLGVVAKIQEWFQQSPQGQPGTFDIVAWANENLTPDKDTVLNDELYRQLKQAVDNAKNVRSHYTFKVGAALKAEPIAAACAASNFVAVSRREAELQQSPAELLNRVGVASRFQIASMIYLKMEASNV